MNKQKIILLFSDLEGTILRELDGQYSDEDMNAFLSQIDELQKLTEAEVHLHLVSPVYIKQMEQIMRKIDGNIAKYNLTNKVKKYIPPIESAAAYPETEMLAEDFLGDRIVALKKPINEMDFDTAQHGKQHYVRLWCETYNESQRKELLMAIYCGNGRNDLTAMNYVNKQKQGFVVCPQNSRREAKAKAFHVSEKTDLLGITEGIEKINREIEKRIKPSPEQDDAR